MSAYYAETQITLQAMTQMSNSVVIYNEETVFITTLGMNKSMWHQCYIWIIHQRLLGPFIYMY